MDKPNRAAISCSQCGKTFQNNSNLKRHCRLLHPSFDFKGVSPKYNFPCSLCNNSFKNSREFNDHLPVEHNLNLESGSLKFQSNSDFYDWKNEVEKEQNSFYVKKTGIKKLGNKMQVIRFYCNRSGCYTTRVSPEQRKRELKYKGSIKINTYCPSKITAWFLQDGTVTGDYIFTHVGHSNDIVHLPIKSEERLEIAGKIASKMPFSDIIETLRSTAKDDITRVSLVQKQDLRNIAKEYSLDCEAVRHSDDALSVEAWVAKEVESYNSCVLFYKPVGSSNEEFSSLSEEDFALGIMTKTQSDLLKSYGEDIICIDSTYGTNPYGFQLTTLLVVDDAREGFPCAYYFTNKNDQKSMELFLGKIKEKVGFVKAKTFMSDMDEKFYNAWEKIMGVCEFRLFCTWHVDRAWRTNLKKITNPNKRPDVYKKLRSLLQETDQTVFFEDLGKMITKFKEDPETECFGNYFEKCYARTYFSWAYCFRKYYGVNTNMYLENLHKQIKYSFLHGKTVKRLDKAIHALMSMTREKLFGRLLATKNMKVASKVKNLRVRHRKSFKLDMNLLINTDERTWVVLSESKKFPQLYTVQQNDSFCQNCHVTCSHCQACIHKFSCTCIDASIKSNMCKHIHLVCRNIRDLNSNSFLSNELNVSTVEVHKDLESQVILKKIRNNPSEGKKKLLIKKKKIKKEVEKLIEDAANEDELDVIRKNIQNCVSTLRAMRNTSSMERAIPKSFEDF